MRSYRKRFFTGSLLAHEQRKENFASDAVHEGERDTPHLLGTGLTLYPGIGAARR